eukprot:CAMPEP_0113936284 /NCGR_PEP_ID=MMETSP1339-20121228/3227_1 /TAXON_ID=94617 /ORGANISM="Fibrocapsa japonica" /LENGTH=204 /DNA_ID=CAMNT_0000938699 /DNA_START=177 /DNA_END=791 /DNA_ORIENTATION=- /assembly_acc=CAM_ASM_000762
MAQPVDHLFKVLLIGDAGVGKSSILMRFTDDTFDEHLQNTIGVDFKVKILDVEGKRVKLTIWDTAGQERFRTLTSSYYRGAHAIILVYDVSWRETFENLSQWLQEVEIYSPNGGKDMVKLLVGNKIDKERQVSKQEAQSWARSRNMIFMEASAKTKVGVKTVFSEVVQKILDNPVLLASTVQKPRGTVNPGQSTTANQGGGCCG